MDQRFKQVTQSLGFGPEVWQWPAGDEKLFCIFEHHIDLEEWAAMCAQRRVVVQAGGATGVFPAKLATLFDQVYTFEPQPENFECLVANVTAENVKAQNAALSDHYGKVSIHHSIGERKNYGAGYIVDDPEGVPLTRIDDLELDACDLIMLDIEGAELEALKGAEETIKAHRPLIVIEDKPLPHMAHFKRAIGDPGRWLEQFGYRYLKRQRWDSVYQC